MSTDRSASAEPRPHVHVILGSTRTGRRGAAVARWVMRLAQERDDATFELVDLADWELPFLTTAVPPMMGGYEDPRTIEWAGNVARADGFVIVTPEYNHGYPAVLKNALDHLFAEWNGKPVGFVGYGGPDGGTRAVEQLRQVVIELGMVPVRLQVTLARAYLHVDGRDTLSMDDRMPDARALLGEVAAWAWRLRDPVRSA